MKKGKEMIKHNFKYLVLLASAFLLSFSYSNTVQAEEDTNFHIATYITGIGCPHCANVAPGLLKEKVNECENNMIIIEYEIYETPENASIIFEFNSNYNSGLGIPQVIFDDSNVLVGDTEINSGFDNRCIDAEENVVSLPGGQTINWYDLDLNELPLYPRIWSKDKIAIRIDNSELAKR